MITVQAARPPLSGSETGFICDLSDLSGATADTHRAGRKKAYRRGYYHHQEFAVRPLHICLIARVPENHSGPYSHSPVRWSHSAHAVSLNKDEAILRNYSIQYDRPRQLVQPIAQSDPC
ncbi:hypothetical protein BO78DRAFT_217670 [Aspergillus sclerotiicarbonarius CBS 121057]|uniref:Uncharacterized protein n=1 Tax=Aspergillus sclerotiicarbonarius (strain CBS 121057 / IBT 28362) TaxID=1448318 RepID=A0A319EP49_ASPSB|nr:hypothetical protein BO78DRAFT_217670 [Aspergillus sclerotiicarbonarius CBS 121057]